MQPELIEYYEERFSTMATKGWIDLMEDVQNLYDIYNKTTTINSVEELYFKKGQLDILQWLLSLKEVSAQTYEELQLEETV